MATRKTINDLINELNLSVACRNPSADDILSYFKYLKCSYEPTLITERYYDSKTCREIWNDHPEFHMYTEEIRVHCNMAVKHLREKIEECHMNENERTLGQFFAYDDLGMIKLGTSKLTTKTTIGEFSKLLYEGNYRPSVYIDRIINILQENSCMKDFPEIMKRNPKYPYNLYIGYNHIKNQLETVSERMTVVNSENECVHNMSLDEFLKTYKSIEMEAKKEFGLTELVVYQMCLVKGTGVREAAKHIGILPESISCVRTTVMRKFHEVALKLNKSMLHVG